MLQSETVNFSQSQIQQYYEQIIQIISNQQQYSKKYTDTGNNLLNPDEMGQTQIKVTQYVKIFETQLLNLDQFSEEMMLQLIDKLQYYSNNVEKLIILNQITEFCVKLLEKQQCTIKLFILFLLTLHQLLKTILDNKLLQFILQQDFKYQSGFYIALTKLITSLRTVDIQQILRKSKHVFKNVTSYSKAKEYQYLKQITNLSLGQLFAIVSNSRLIHFMLLIQLDFWSEYLQTFIEQKPVFTNQSIKFKFEAETQQLSLFQDLNVRSPINLLKKHEFAQIDLHLVEVPLTPQFSISQIVANISDIKAAYLHLYKLHLVSALDIFTVSRFQQENLDYPLILPNIFQATINVCDTSNPVKQDLAMCSFEFIIQQQSHYLQPYLLLLISTLRFTDKLSNILIEFGQKSAPNQSKLNIFLETFSTISGSKSEFSTRIKQIQDSFEEQNGTKLFYDLVKISDELIHVNDSQRQKQMQLLITELTKEETPLLTDSSKIITGINVNSCRTLKSHAKVPLLINAQLNNNTNTGFIIKANDSVIQDHAVMIILNLFKTAFKGINLQLTTYNIFPLTNSSGFIELLQNANSLDEIGNRTQGFLFNYFSKFMTAKARQNFIESQAAYSTLSYLLKFKDRHNGNIMLNQDGRVIHIDFGFFFDSAPGGKFSFERAPFKMSSEALMVIGGKNTPGFAVFSQLFRRGMLATKFIQREAQSIIQLLFGILPSIKSQSSVNEFKDRCMCGLWGKEFTTTCDKLIDESVGSLGNSVYDIFQALSNDINYK
ncbi:Phosphatidylinositol_4-kinase [Hexamita inflata]|uniref:Phosphatidylinositol 4-kinase n=1 Tax=Hexamita inflata TaxID=28002 RepID=A0AA86VMU5_9EUKA|nr:Phosphatidylinositol 4-kinase [Hexamita inflata]